MCIPRIAQNLFDGTSWRHFNDMSDNKRSKLTLKVIAVAIVAGLLTAMATVTFSTVAAVILIPTIAIASATVAFAYATRNYPRFSPSDYTPGTV